MDPVVAELHLEEVSSEGLSRPLSIRIGLPKEQPEGEWGCPLSITDGPSRDIYGLDSFQALCLAIRVAMSHLDHLQDRGSRLLLAGGYPFPISAYSTEPFRTPPPPADDGA